MEIEYAFLTDKPVFKKNKDYSEYHIEQNKEQIIKLYYQQFDKYQKEYHQLAIDWQMNSSAFGSKTCRYCQGKLRYINGYDFWGCENYLQPGEHSRFSGLEPEIRKERPRVSSFIYF